MGPVIRSALCRLNLRCLRTGHVPRRFLASVPPCGEGASRGGFGARADGTQAPGLPNSWRPSRRVAMVPAHTDMPLSFLVELLAESLTEVSGGWAAARFPIVDSQFDNSSTLAANGHCRLRQGRAVEPFSFGVADEVGCNSAIGPAGGRVSLAGVNTPAFRQGFALDLGNTLVCRFVRYARACPASARPSPTLRAAHRLRSLTLHVTCPPELGRHASPG
jgi:hypothetical protein